MRRTTVFALLVGIVIGGFAAQCVSERRVRSQTVCAAALQSIAYLEESLRSKPLAIVEESFGGFMRRVQDAADRNCTWIDLPPWAALPTPAPSR